MRMAGIVLALLPMLGVGQTPVCNSTATGDLTVVPFANRTFGTQGFLNIWLPPGYGFAANATRKFPVLYMLDGQILFDDCRGGVPEWHVDETLTRLIEGGRIEPLIVVGIDAGNRQNEFLPYRDSVFSPASPEPLAKRFPDFMADEVIPFVRGHYRVEDGAQAIGGGSYGGVAALYALLARPDLFHLGLIESPSLAVGNGQLLRDTEHLFKGPARVYLGMGGREAGPDENSSENLGYVEMIRTLQRNLEAVTVDPPAILTVIRPHANHSPNAWSARFEEAVEFLYAR